MAFTICEVHYMHRFSALLNKTLYSKSIHVYLFIVLVPASISMSYFLLDPK